MAIEVNETVVETFTATEASPQTITLSTAVAGDVRVVVMNHSPDGTATIGTVTIPSGWTEMSTNTNTGAASDSKLTMMYRVWQSGDATTVSVTTSTNMTVGAICVTYEGVDTTNVEDAVAPSMGTGTGGAVCPTITTVTDNAWVGRAGIVDGTAAPIQDADVPASHTLRGAMDNNPPSNGMSLGLADEIQVSFGSAGTATWGNGGSEEYVGATFAIRPLLGPTITSVDSDDEVDDKQTGVIVAGSAFEASQGTGVVEIADRTDNTITEDLYDESNQFAEDNLNSLNLTGTGQSFTGRGGVLRKAVFFMRIGAGSPTGNAQAHLYAHSGTFGTSSVPTGSALISSATVDVTTLTGTLALVEFTFSGSQTLTDGTNYVITVEYSGGDLSNYVSVGTDTIVPSHAGNKTTIDPPSGWISNGSHDLIFYVLTDPIEQTVTAWGDTSITITMVMGRLHPAFEPTGTRLMFVTNDSDELSPGFPFTLHRSEAFGMAASANIAASGENTTAQLAAPSGKSTGDFDGGRIQDDENPGDTINVTADNYREDEWCIEAVDDAETGEQYEFRLIFSGSGAPAGTISVTPKWTVTAGTPVSNTVTGQTEAMQGLAGPNTGQAESLQAIDSANVGQTESIESRSSASTGQAESLQGVSGTVTGQTAALGRVASPATGQTESLQSIQGANVGQAESIETVASAVTGQSEALQQIASPNIGQAESLETVTAPNTGQVESLGPQGVSNSVTGQSEALQAIRSSVVSQVESLESIAAAVTGQTESLQGVDAANTGQAESLQGIDAANTGQAESLQGIDSANTGQAESIESRTSALTGQVESLEGVESASIGQTEALESVVSANTGQTEARGEIGVSKSVTGQTEALQGLTSLVSGQVESVASLGVGVTGQTESLQGIDAANIGQAEALASVVSVNTGQTEARGAIGVSNSITGQIEALQGLTSTMVGQAESLASLLVSITGQTESLRDVLQSTTGQVEALQGLFVPNTGQVEVTFTGPILGQILTGEITCQPEIAAEITCAPFLVGIITCRPFHERTIDMPTFGTFIDDVVIGDDVSIRRTINFASTGFETGTTINKAWLTMKAAIDDGDPGIFQKAVTVSDLPGTGQIENDGTGDVNMIVRFDLVPADTIAIGLSLRHWDIQVRTAAGRLYTPEKGRMVCIEGVTQATS